MFKIGDRVKCVKVCDGNRSAAGKEGRVIGVADARCGVEFYERLDPGHRTYSTGGKGKNGYCWNFPVEGGYLELVTEQKTPTSLVTIEVFDRTTVAKLREGDKVIRTGVARCNPSDTFDAYEGARLALDRLYGKTEPYKRPAKEAVRIVKQDRYEVGDKVKIVDAWVPGCGQNSSGLMDKWLGKIMTIREVKCLHCCMEEDQGDRPGGWNWFAPAIAGKVVADKPSEVREVKRPAKVGEWIKIVDCLDTRYKNGDVFKVVRLHDKGLPFVLWKAIPQLEAVVKHSEYVVLEGYEPGKVVE